MRLRGLLAACLTVAFLLPAVAGERAKLTWPMEGYRHLPAAARLAKAGKARLLVGLSGGDT